jgi:putative membrane protein
VQMHKRLNSLAMLLSVMFLLSYVVYHYFAGDTEYLGDFKRIYVFILVTHIFLAGLSLPFILLAYYHGFIGNLVKHKKMVRFVYPIWLYVTCTGVIVYLFLAPYYA